MIGAVVGLHDASRVESFLVALAEAGGQSSRDARLVAGASSGLMASAALSSARLDPAARVAWLGQLRGYADGAPRGDFALVGLKPDGGVIAGRGRFGGRPLYYAKLAAHDAQLICSELAPLLSVVGNVRVDDERLAADLLHVGAHDSGQTHYREIRRIPSATMMRFGADGTVSASELPFEVRPSRGGPVGRLAEEVRDACFASIGRAIEGEPSIGVLTSGGLDSSATLAIASALARRSGQRVQAFNFRFADRSDDRPHLDALSRSLGLKPVCITPRECASEFVNALVIDGAPVGWPTAALHLVLGRRAREEGASVLLSGIGGDEVFGGDNRFFVDHARSGHMMAAMRSAWLLRGWGATPLRRVDALVLRPRLKGVLPAVIRTTAERWRRAGRLPAWAGPSLRRLNRGDRVGAWIPVDSAERSTDKSWLSSLSRSAFYLAMSEARAHMELVTGCARADPFLDDELVDFMASLRPEYLFHGNWVRGLFREALRGLIPESVRTRPDKGFYERAFSELLSAAGGLSSLGGLAKVEALADLGLVDPRRFAERSLDLERDPTNGPVWLEVWAVLACEAFLRQTPGA